MERLPGEPELVRRFQNGDPSVFGAIMAHYEPYVLGLFKRMTPDVAQAEDLCQETFLKVLKGLGRFKGESGLGTWIFRIAHNIACDSFRSPKGKAYSLDQMTEDGAGEPQAAGPLPAHNLDEASLRTAVERAMEILPSAQR